jgi:thioredoxin reductase
LKQPNIHIHTDHKLIEINGNAIILEDQKEQKRITIDVNKIVICLGVKKNNSLYTQLRDELDPVLLIGDAYAPRRIADAIREGFDKGFSLN